MGQLLSSGGYRNWHVLGVAGDESAEIVAPPSDPVDIILVQHATISDPAAVAQSYGLVSALGRHLITSMTLANPTVVTTATDHEMTSGDTVVILGADSNPLPLFIPYVVTVTGAKTFTIPLNVSTGAGTTGYALSQGKFLAGPVQLSATGPRYVSYGEMRALPGHGVYAAIEDPTTGSFSLMSRLINK